MNRPGKIVCVGRNYVEHAAELGNIVPKMPLLSLKPPSAVIPDGGTIVLPAVSRKVEHEAEIGTGNRHGVDRGNVVKVLGVDRVDPKVEVRVDRAAPAVDLVPHRTR